MKPPNRSGAERSAQSQPSSINLFWFRRDLRLHDNAGLYHALRSGLPVLPMFIFDTEILDELEDRADRRVSFIYRQISRLTEELNELGAALEVHHGKPLQVFKKLAETYSIHTVFANHDYEPYAIQRDELVKKQLEHNGTDFRSFKDQVIFEKAEVIKNDGQPYFVFTPYSRKWLSLLSNEHLSAFRTSNHFKAFHHQKQEQIPNLKEMGFVRADDDVADASLDKDIISHYHQTRDIPSVHGTTRIGIHLRFGTISVRQAAARAQQLNKTFLNELIWREFFMQLLWHFPRLVTECCKTEYENIKWRNNAREFERWCTGQTGYPIVDAGMRELNETGFMHNRVRMITASFLVKHLLIDWRWGEAYFAKKLLDYELSSNNGNWQWVAGCGCDAAPYFRVFSPEAQTKRFDPQLTYIKKWVPELDTLSYPAPMVEHEAARERCLSAYKKALAAARN